MDVAQTVFMIYVGILGPVAMWLVLRRVDRLEARGDALPTREEMNARFDAHEKRFDAIDGRFDRLESELGALRSDLTQIALAVGARPRPQTG